MSSYTTQVDDREFVFEVDGGYYGNERLNLTYVADGSVWSADVIREEGSESPRRAWDNVTYLWIGEGRDFIGCNEGPFSSELHQLFEAHDHGLAYEMARLFLLGKGVVGVLPVYRQDNWEATYSTDSEPTWSGVAEPKALGGWGISGAWGNPVGVIYMTREQWVDGWGVSEVLGDKVFESLQGDVQLYSQWASGEVFGAEIEATGESSWGFYGDDHAKSGLLDYVASEIAWHINRRYEDANTVGAGFIGVI